MINPCACGSEKSYAQCCQPYLEGITTPLTPEALMRSRYTAYTLSNMNYIAETMKGPAAKNFHIQEALTWAEQATWLKLEVLQASTNADNTQGTVEFRAHYLFQHKRQIMHERSEFLFEQGRWYYVDGQQMADAIKTPEKVGRNNDCPCGSQKKYKKCCGNRPSSTL